MSNSVQDKWLPPASSKENAGALEIDSFDFIEIYSGNARQSALFYCTAFGFTPAAYRGPETGCRDTVSYVLTQNSLRLIITTPLKITHPASAEIHLHGDFVKSLALQVSDCEAFYYEAMRRGALSAEVPHELSDDQGACKLAAIKIYGDTVHHIVERKAYKGLHLPGFIPIEKILPDFGGKTTSVGLLQFDHVVGNVELGKMNEWVSFYERVLGFTQMQQFSDDDISTEYSALMSKVMRNGTGRVKFPINEPAHGKRKSQIDEYLEFNNGPGVQHVAIQTNDIIQTVTEMRKRGVSFLRVPKTYYDEVPKRVGKIKEDLEKIAQLGILVDRDDEGYLLQIFTKPVQDRPTVFFEIIQREGSKGFGIGNFKALFEAIEREQALRGNL